MTTNNWIASTEATLDGRGTDEDVTILEGQRPPVLDGDGADALIAPWLAGFLWAAAIFRETQSGHTDPIALLLRWLALGLTVRATRLGYRLLRRVRLSQQASRYRLAIHDDGLLLRTPTADVPIARHDVVDVREQGDWRTRSGRRFHDVYLVTRPSSGRLMYALPPLFDGTPGLLAERLMRWLGPPPAEPPTFPAPDPLPGKLYDVVAEGQVLPGVIAVPHGNRWRERGPYFSFLLGVVLAERWLQLTPELRQALGVTPLLLIAACVVVLPLLWYRGTQRLLAPRRGLSLVFTPAELLMRTRAGVHRVAWRSFKQVTVETRRSWSILGGNRLARTLRIERVNDTDLRYEELFLGLPAEVVCGLMEAHRRGRLP